VGWYIISRVVTWPVCRIVVVPCVVYHSDEWYNQCVLLVFSSNTSDNARYEH
jgi:hypothetical protein